MAIQPIENRILIHIKSIKQAVFERNYNVNFRLFAKKQTPVFNINALPVPPVSAAPQPQPQPQHHPPQLPSPARSAHSPRAFPRPSCSQSRVQTVGLFDFSLLTETPLTRVYTHPPCRLRLRGGNNV